MSSSSQMVHFPSDTIARLRRGIFTLSESEHEISSKMSSEEPITTQYLYCKGCNKSWLKIVCFAQCELKDIFIKEKRVKYPLLFVTTHYVYNTIEWLLTFLWAASLFVYIRLVWTGLWCTSIIICLDGRFASITTGKTGWNLLVR